jgi:hypothetical protein
MKTYNYINAPEILTLVTNFSEQLAMDGVSDFNVSKHKNLRNLMIAYFKAELFQSDYFRVAKVIIEEMGLDVSTVLLQKIPTPRIFRPGDHGTSFHSDYWYGHGDQTITVWTPLSSIEEGNSFFILPTYELNASFTKALNESNGVASPAQEELLAQSSHSVSMDIGSSIIFPSNILHGSPCNKTDKVRVSFDFRIANKNDITSTKDPESYFIWMNNTFVADQNRFSGANYIKYICGGKHKNTLAQHLIIESVVKEYDISISGQEAEVERFGQPIFREYLNGLAHMKKIDGLIVASRSILDDESIQAAKDCNTVKIYCALENEFIDFKNKAD